MKESKVYELIGEASTLMAGGRVFDDSRAGEIAEEIVGEIKKLRDVVEFYADQKTWGKTNQKNFNRVYIDDCEEVKSHQYQGVWYSKVSVGGKRARQCLEEINSKRDCI